MVLFISFHLSLQSFWHCSRNTINIFFGGEHVPYTADTTVLVPEGKRKGVIINSMKRNFLDFLECENGDGK